MSGIEMHHHVARQYAWCKTGVPAPDAAEVKALLYDLDEARARVAALEAIEQRARYWAEEWTRSLVDGKGRHVAIRQAWPELAKFLDALTDDLTRED